MEYIRKDKKITIDKPKKKQR